MNKIKKGDEVICIPGFESNLNDRNPKYGGAGYDPDYKFIVHRITNTRNGDCAWAKNSSVGVYVKALKLVSDEPQYEIY